MSVTATQARSRFGQLLEQAQHGPVVIEKAGRRHSVLLSAAQYDELVAARPVPAEEPTVPNPSPEGRAFYEKYKEWVDMHNDLVEKHGLFGEEYRVW